jgi:hypothetical protein
MKPYDMADVKIYLNELPIMRQRMLRGMAEPRENLLNPFLRQVQLEAILRAALATRGCMVSLNGCPGITQLC